MSKKSSVERNTKRMRLVKKYQSRRMRLREMLHNKEVSAEERFEVALKMQKAPRNSSPIRVRNRCLLTGRSRGYYRKFQVSRIAFRELASAGLIPGVVKSSW